MLEKINALFVKSLFYILKILILLGLILIHIILFFFINFYIVKHFPNFYSTIFRMLEYGVVDVWPVLVSPQEYLERTSGDPILVPILLSIPPVMLIISLFLLISYIMAWPIFLIHYWGLICYNFLSAFFFWIPNWSTEIFNFPYSYYIIICAIIYFILVVYILVFKKDLNIVSKRLAKFIALWLFAIIAILIWYIFFAYYHSIVWFIIKTVLYFSGVSLLIVKIIKSEIK